MTNKKAIIVSALAGIIAVGCATHASTAEKGMMKKGKYHCKGVAIKGGNDCAAHGHQCAGKAKKNFDPKEWAYTYDAAACKTIQKALKNGHIRDYITMVQKKTIVSTKRNM